MSERRFRLPAGPRGEFPHLRNPAKVLWSRSYFAVSVEYVSEPTVRRYIEQQWEAVLAL